MEVRIVQDLMLNYFKRYLTERGGEEPMVAMLNAYNISLAKREALVRFQIFKAYPTIFKVSMTGKLLV